MPAEPGRNNKPADGLTPVILWLALLWAIELADHLLTWALVPKAGLGADGLLDNLAGLHPWDHSLPFWPQIPHALLGMVCAPLLHGGWGHLIANSLAIALLGIISFRYSHRLTGVAILYSTVLSAALTWVIAPATMADGTPIVHIGASGVIFGLVGFLLGNGIFRRGCLPLFISGVVLLLYGGSLGGMLPHMVDDHISWQMHLGGFIGGLAASWHLRHERQ